MYSKISAYEISQIAIGMEEDGFQFYQQASKYAGNEKIKAVFLKLANDEIEHKNEFAGKDFARYFGEVSDSVMEMDRYIKDMFKTKIFPSVTNAKEHAHHIKNDEEALLLGVEQERRAIKFYTELKRLAASKDAGVAIEEMIQEEKKHLKILLDIIVELHGKK